MTNADKIFKENLRDILDGEWEVDKRAKWADGTPIKTKRMIQVVNKYDLSKEFPVITLRPTGFKNAIDEILWIYQKRSNNIRDLNSKIWNAWADEGGSIGKAYGYQVDKPVFGHASQIDYVLSEVKNNPTSRRIMINMFNAEDMDDKALVECAYGLHFSVKRGKLYATLIQRSNDFLVANNWNLVQYSILTHMIARHCDLEVGEFTHFIQDLHIYNKHEENALEMLTREGTDVPKLWINPDVTDFYDFTVDDFKLEGYEPEKQLRFEVAE